MKIPQKILEYFSSTWTKENRLKVLKTFKVKKDYREINYNNNYIERKKMNHKIQIYDRTNPLFQEFNDLKLNIENWYDLISRSARNYLKELCLRFKNEENRKPNYSLTAGQIKFIDNQIFYLQEFFKQDDDYFCFLRKDMTLRDSSIKKFIYDRLPPYKPKLLLLKVKLYAIENKKPWFNEKGNLLPKIIKDFLSGKMILPISKEQKARRSTEYTRQTFMSLARCNAESFKYFVTLTFAEKEEKEKHIENNLKSVKFNEYNLKFTYVEDPTNYELCVKKMHSFFMRLNKESKEMNFDLMYLGVPEYQKNGNIHYHFLMNELPKKFFYDIPGWLDFDKTKNARRYDEGLKLWVYGKSTIEQIASRDRVTTYISKYLIKSLNEILNTQYEERLFKRRFYYSRNLVKPKIEYDTYYNQLEENKEDFNCVKLITKNNSTVFNESQTILYQLKSFDNELEENNFDFSNEEDWL